MTPDSYSLKVLVHAGKGHETTLDRAAGMALNIYKYGSHQLSSFDNRRHRVCTVNGITRSCNIPLGMLLLLTDLVLRIGIYITMSNRNWKW
jgi:hypothetical protein